ncbi:MAG: hypothetical protein AAGJ40_04700 [Planctomycetota bacterium]
MDPLDELPDGFRSVVARIANDPVPDDLVIGVRSRLKDQCSSIPDALVSTLPRDRDGNCGDPHQLPIRAKLLWTTAAVTSLAAVLLAAIVFSRRVDHDPPTFVDDDDKDDTVESLRPSPSGGPSLWAYHQAAVDSPDRLNSLLSEHSAVMLASEHTRAGRTRLFSTSQFLED